MSVTFKFRSCYGEMGIGKIAVEKKTS